MSLAEIYSKIITKNNAAYDLDTYNKSTEVGLPPEPRWSLRLGPSERVPDQSTKILVSISNNF